MNSWMLFAWLIGWAFSVGALVYEDDTVVDRFMKIIILMFLWPIALGVGLQRR